MPSLTDDRRRQLLREVLPLVATDMHDAAVPLTARRVGVGSEARSDMNRFLSTVRARHALGCALRLHDVLPRVERAASSESRSTRTVNRGSIRGRVDIPAYVRDRRRHAGPNREFPVIVTQNFPETPENRLATWLMSSLRQALRGAPLPPASAEWETARRARVWLSARLAREPWCDVSPSRRILRLRLEAEHRIRRRRTGNQQGYRALTRVVDDWILAPESLGGDRIESLMDGLLAFPVADSFWERVFEIWCLWQAGQALERLDFTASEPARPLASGSGEIFRYARDGLAASVWFQRQKPLGPPGWSYRDGGPLRGIPDVVVSAPGRPPFVIDAKLRWMSTNTRSEETYKMLGYAENFQNAFAAGFFGALVFVGQDSRSRELSGPNDGRLAILVHDADADALAGLLAGQLRAWLDPPAGG